MGENCPPDLHSLWNCLGEDSSRCPVHFGRWKRSVRSEESRGGGKNPTQRDREREAESFPFTPVPNSLPGMQACNWAEGTDTREENSY